MRKSNIITLAQRIERLKTELAAAEKEFTERNGNVELSAELIKLDKLASERIGYISPRVS